MPANLSKVFKNIFNHNKKIKKQNGKKIINQIKYNK